MLSLSSLPPRFHQPQPGLCCESAQLGAARHCREDATPVAPAQAVEPDGLAMSGDGDSGAQFEGEASLGSHTASDSPPETTNSGVRGQAGQPRRNTPFDAFCACSRTEQPSCCATRVGAATTSRSEDENDVLAWVVALSTSATAPKPVDTGEKLETDGGVVAPVPALVLSRMSAKLSGASTGHGHRCGCFGTLASQQPPEKCWDGKVAEAVKSTCALLSQDFAAATASKTLPAMSLEASAGAASFIAGGTPSGTSGREAALDNKSFALRSQ